MPVAWELRVPEVAEAVAQVQSVLPDWKNKTEIVLAHRLNSYDVQRTINWKMEEDERCGTKDSSSKGKGGRSEDSADVAQMKLQLQEFMKQLDEQVGGAPLPQTHSHTLTHIHAYIHMHTHMHTLSNPLPLHLTA